jgi:putative nucleotidyltransferase with HDIG domain
MALYRNKTNIMATVELSPKILSGGQTTTHDRPDSPFPWEMDGENRQLAPSPELEESQGDLLLLALRAAKELGVPKEQVEVELELVEQMDAMHRPLCSHCLRVSLLSTKAAELLGADPAVAQVSGILHDVGKMGVDPKTLKKTVKYTPEDYEKMNRHSQVGFNILRHYKDLPGVVPLVAGTHHKRQLSNENGMDDHDMSPEARKQRDAVTIADQVDSRFRDDGRADNRTPEEREAQILALINYVLEQDTYNGIPDKDALAKTIMHTLLETRAQILEPSEPVHA